MTSEDDCLARLMANIDPAQTPDDTHLTPTSRALLERIVATPHTKPKSRRWPRVRSWGGMSLLTAVTIAVALVVTGALPGLNQTSASWALTPKPLDFKPIEMTPTQLLDTVSNKLTPTTLHDRPQRAAHDVGWYLQQETLAEGQVRSVISPQVTDLEWAEDQSGRLVVTAGEPYWSDGDTSAASGSDVPRPGEVLSDTTFAPGEFDVPVVDEPGRTVEELRQTLQALGLAEEPTGIDTIEAVYSLLMLWTLTDQQHASLLALVLRNDDVQVLGITTDRDGREAIGIAAENTSGLRDILLISTRTGRIIALETITTVPRGDVPAGSTTLYTLWKDTQ